MSGDMDDRGDDVATDRKEAVVIVNPSAHNAPKRKRLDEADEWLREQGWHVEWRETAGPGHATDIAAAAAARRVPLLFACGGDGTLSEAANGLAGSGTALAVIPGGTVNLWAREVGMLKKPLGAVRLAIEGERRLIDLGKAGNRYFMLMAGFGIDASVTHNVSHRIKGGVGALAYAIAAVREALTYGGTRVTMRLDGEERTAEVMMLLAANTRNYAGLAKITPDAVVDDGLLDVCVYEGSGRLDIMPHAVRTLLRLHRGSKKVLYRRVKTLEMSWEHPVPVQLDGDAVQLCPSLVTMAPAALWVAVPRDLASPLFSHRSDRQSAIV
jgi:YegS/Rv2252/BmrU family lipid kinase